MDSITLRQLGIDALAGLVANPMVSAVCQTSERGVETLRLRLVGSDIQDEACVYGDNAEQVVRRFQKAVKKRLKEERHG